ncbi:hypothetical protein IJ182_07685 [bacterium]|nr:hypothetical protein [bacterium]
MATKKITKSGTYNITVNAKSKDTVYQFKNSTVASTSVLNFIISGSMDYQYARSGNDLIIFTEFGTQPDLYETITTIKDYYTYASINNNLVQESASSVYNNVKDTENIFANGTIIDDSTKRTYTGNKKTNTYNFANSEFGNIIYEAGGNDAFNLFNSAAIYEYKGNDKYNLAVTGNATINDYAGKDGYIFTSSNPSKVFDFRGDDSYIIANSEITGDNKNKNTIYDYNGKDNYIITKSKGVNITDSNGNDKYTIKNCEDLEHLISKKTIEIGDKKGNDIYNLSKVSYTTAAASQNIYDYEGKDKYNFVAVKNVVIKDDSGKDTYNISLSSNVTVNEISTTSDNDVYKISDSDSIEITDLKGSEKYTFNNVSNSIIEDYTSDNDKYVLSNYSDNITVVDYGGDDNYSLNTVSNSSIEDKKGNDKYNVQNSIDLKIVEALGDDKYTYKNVQATEENNCLIQDDNGKDNYKITSSKLKIVENDGNDTYNITSSDIIISDSRGDDTYNLTNNISVKITDANPNTNDTYKLNKITGKTDITDNGGGKDNLVLSKANAKNIIYMADFTTTTGKVASGSIFIFDKTSNGSIKVNNYLNTASAEITGTTGNGKIESIKAGKTEFVSKIDNFYGSSTNYAQLASDVASWLSTNTGYINISDLVNDGSQSQIQDFIAYFSNK